MRSRACRSGCRPDAALRANDDDDGCADDEEVADCRALEGHHGLEDRHRDEDRLRLGFRLDGRIHRRRHRDVHLDELVRVRGHHGREEVELACRMRS